MPFPKQPIVGICAALAFTVAPSARAQEAPPPAERPSLARLELGFGTLIASENEVRARQSRFTISPEFAVTPRLRIAPMLRLTSTDIDLLQKDSMDFDAELSLPWQPSLGAKGSFQVVEFWKLRLHLLAEFEFPLGENEAWLQSFTPRGKIEDLPIDVQSLRNHVSLRHRWRNLQASVRTKGDFGILHPYVDLGLLAMDSRLAVNFDETAQDLLKDAELSPERQFDTDVIAPFYMLGADLDLGAGFSFRLQGSWMKYQDKSFFTLESGLYVPMDLGF